ncbi:MAG: sugar phosphate isomerase/epimerase, partial [SAR324 cluster bacterium]|nr:sugar phosphate isomerase/epimerase [SAR324 cluster bacterium]
ICKRNARESWERWASYLEGKKVQTGLEVLSRINTNFLNTADECARFLEGLTGPHLGLTLDTHHMNIEEDNLIEPIRRHAGILKVVQVAENHREVPGTGHLPWREFLATLREVGYDGFLSFEIPPDVWGQRPPREPEAVLRAGLEFLRREMESL